MSVKSDNTGNKTFAFEKIPRISLICMLVPIPGIGMWPINISHLRSQGNQNFRAKIEWFAERSLPYFTITGPFTKNRVSHSFHSSFSWAHKAIDSGINYLQISALNYLLVPLCYQKPAIYSFGSSIISINLGEYKEWGMVCNGYL